VRRVRRPRAQLRGPDPGTCISYNVHCPTQQRLCHSILILSLLIN
jgi:hypothetical protein